MSARSPSPGSPKPSAAGAAPGAVFALARDHAATEDAIRRSGTDRSVLRCNLYHGILPTMLAEDGTIRGLGAQGRATPGIRRHGERVARPRERAGLAA
ncbi:hypothetical protein [Rathayibacter tritici]|uniref:hypothetical protein n=1 Tax=Rathayibacter tritici TaxID=33888 RepID=UPI000A7AD2BA|nr:hypothetical protein [Rathayibacter tritici]